MADRLLVALGFPKLYHAANPFDWMEAISLQARGFSPLLLLFVSPLCFVGQSLSRRERLVLLSTSAIPRPSRGPEPYY